LPSSHTFSKLNQRYGPIFRAAKFGIAGAAGFLIAEAILTVGILVIYGNLNVTSVAYASTTLLELNILAFGIGVTVAFFINEKITVANEVGALKKARSVTSVIFRLLKFQLVYAAGNAVTIGVQLVLLKWISLAPSIGNIIGAIVAFPLSYFISMKVVWKTSGLARSQIQDTIVRNEGNEKQGVQR
jgi:putative flippase GtrA